MRSHSTVDVGQVWADNDRRRLRLVRVHFVGESDALVCNLYPNTGRIQRIPLARFVQVGSKGLSRVL